MVRYSPGENGELMKRKESWVSKRRLEPYMKQTAGNQELAWDLYEWNAEISAALFEVIHHVEVLVRNAMMRQLEALHPLAYPWNRPNADSIGTVASKLTNKKSNRAPDENDVIFQLNLGFWAELAAPSDFQKSRLWESHLHNAFPGQEDQKLVALALEDLRQLRNHCSHQDSLLHFDPSVELNKIQRLVGWIDSDAVGWIRSISRVDEVVAARPKVKDEPDTIILASTRHRNVVPGRSNFRYPLFDCYHQKQGVILEDSTHVSQEVKYLGFYLPKNDEESTDQSIYLADQPKAHIATVFPQIEDRVVPNEWSKEEAKRLARQSKRDQKVAALIKYGLGNGYTAGRNYVIYLLTTADDPRTGRAPVEIVHDAAGQGSAFVKLTRYFRLDSLKTARQTSDLT